MDRRRALRSLLIAPLAAVPAAMATADDDVTFRDGEVLTAKKLNRTLRARR